MSPIYYRMFGYVATIVMHTTNIVFMDRKLSGEVSKDPVINSFIVMQARYFTCWTFFLQIAYAFIGLSCDLLTLKNTRNKSYKLPKHLKGCRNTLFAGIQWPSTLLVFTIFWSLFHYDRDLILPPILDQVLSRASNHVIHTAVVPVVLWELLFRPRTEPRSHTRNLIHLLLHYVFYFAVLFYTYIVDDRWLYPVFGRLYGTIYFPLFIAVIGALLCVFYYIQWPLTRLLWGTKKMCID